MLHSAARCLALSFAVSIAASTLGGLALAQRPPAQLDGARILHRMRELEVVGSVLYVAAHPDDENTRLIAWLANCKQVRTGYLSLTRGDGGQNLIGPELGDALGILRTQELLEARRIDGGEQFFTRAVDFGFSKSPDESFAKWGKQNVLADVVRVIRQFRPDVILTRFDTDGSGGHGHHTASAILAREAFDLAADPKAFPEQIAEGLEPWQTQSLYFNGSTWWRADLADYAAKDPTHWTSVDVGGYDPLLGLSYTELAGRSRSMHKSQGFGTAETRGEALECLRLDRDARDRRRPSGDAGDRRPPGGATDGRERSGARTSASPTLFDGIDLTWGRLRDGARVQAQIRALVDAYDPRTPENSLAGLETLVRTLDEIGASDDPERAWARAKADAARRLILHVCGAAIEVTADTARIAAGDTTRVSLSTLLRRPTNALSVEDFVGPGGARATPRASLVVNRSVVADATLVLPAQPTIDQPYWLAMPHDTLYHPIAGQYAGVEPASRLSSSFTGTLKLADGLEVHVERALMNKWVDRVAGERTRPVVVTPVASVRVVDPVVIVRGEHAVVSVEVEALSAELTGSVQLTLPEGWSVETPSRAINGLKRGERRTVSIGVTHTPGARHGKAHATFSGPTGTADATLHVIDYPHILPQTWYSPADVALLPFDVAVNVAKVGYVDGAGDDVANALRRLGVDVVTIDPSTARAEDLDACDAIVTGIRAYNTVGSLARFQPELLAFVERGGTLLVQYNTNGNDMVLNAKSIGPYPFSLTRNRVTVEEAPPTFLAPDHPLMKTPNALGAADFEGWVQERGLYFVGDVDPHYTALVAWNDPGEKPLDGALIACDHGKGRFVYTGLSLFRQLPAGVPGAYRLLANLIARRTPRAAR